MRVVACPDKFRGTASAAEVAGAVAAAAATHGWRCDRAPVADGGEGTLDVLGGPNRRTIVSGPLGDPVEAEWRLDRRDAVVEMARASGLELVGGPEGNDPIAATTAGTGELIVEAVESGARRIIVGVGGSATTDGGYGAVTAMEPLARLRGIEVRVACDVRIPFVEAARRFAPQKGAGPAQVELLTRRLERLVQIYRERFGVDVSEMPMSGAAGGLAGGLAAALGAELVPGFELVADRINLAETMGGSDLIVTGEGFLDDQSFDGKVVGGVIEMAADVGVPVLVVAGQILEQPPSPVEAVSLADRFGLEAAMSRPLELTELVVGEKLASLSGR